MKVYTRTGDDGSTRLADGSKVSKGHPRVAAYGDVDELNSVLGVLRAEAVSNGDGGHLERAQNALFEVGTLLADPRGRGSVGADVSDTAWLEEWIDAMDRELPPLRSFVLPAGVRAAALAHQARTVCRRAERRVVRLAVEAPEVGLVVPLLNRLSDALFVFARQLNHRAGIGDVPWRREI